MVSSPTGKQGSSRFGCLLILLLLLSIIYTGFKLGPPWLRYQQYRDEMRTNARFAISLPDSVIHQRLVDRADTLGLPTEAKHLTIRRTVRPAMIRISADYNEYVDLILLGRKKLHFHPTVEEPL